MVLSEVSSSRSKSAGLNSLQLQGHSESTRNESFQVGASNSKTKLKPTRRNRRLETRSELARAKYLKSGGRGLSSGNNRLLHRKLAPTQPGKPVVVRLIRNLLFFCHCLQNQLIQLKSWLSQACGQLWNLISDTLLGDNLNTSVQAIRGGRGHRGSSHAVDHENRNSARLNDLPDVCCPIELADNFSEEQGIDLSAITDLKEQPIIFNSLHHLTSEPSTSSSIKLRMGKRKQTNIRSAERRESARSRAACNLNTSDSEHQILVGRVAQYHREPASLAGEQIASRQEVKQARASGRRSSPTEDLPLATEAESPPASEATSVGQCERLHLKEAFVEATAPFPLAERKLDLSPTAESRHSKFASWQSEVPREMELEPREQQQQHQHASGASGALEGPEEFRQLEQEHGCQQQRGPVVRVSASGYVPSPPYSRIPSFLSSHKLGNHNIPLNNALNTSANTVNNSIIYSSNGIATDFRKDMRSGSASNHLHEERPSIGNSEQASDEVGQRFNTWVKLKEQQQNESLQNQPQHNGGMVLVSKDVLSDLTNQITASLDKMRSLEDKISVIPELQRQLDRVSSTSERNVQESPHCNPNQSASHHPRMGRSSPSPSLRDKLTNDPSNTYGKNQKCFGSRNSVHTRSFRDADGSIDTKHPLTGISFQRQYNSFRCLPRSHLGETSKRASLASLVNCNESHTQTTNNLTKTATLGGYPRKVHTSDSRRVRADSSTSVNTSVSIQTGKDYEDLISDLISLSYSLNSGQPSAPQASPVRRASHSVTTTEQTGRLEGAIASSILEGESLTQDISTRRRRLSGAQPRTELCSSSTLGGRASCVGDVARSTGAIDDHSACGTSGNPFVTQSASNGAAAAIISNLTNDSAHEQARLLSTNKDTRATNSITDSLRVASSASRKQHSQPISGQHSVATRVRNFNNSGATILDQIRDDLRKDFSASNLAKLLQRNLIVSNNNDISTSNFNNPNCFNQESVENSLPPHNSRQSRTEQPSSSPFDTQTRAATCVDNLSAAHSSLNTTRGNSSTPSSNEITFQHQCEGNNKINQTYRYFGAINQQSFNSSMKTHSNVTGNPRNHHRSNGSLSLQVTPTKSAPPLDCGCQSIREHIKYNLLSREQRLNSNPAALNSGQPHRSSQLSVNTNTSCSNNNSTSVSPQPQQVTKTNKSMPTLVDVSTNTELSMKDLLSRDELNQLLKNMVQNQVIASANLITSSTLSLSSDDNPVKMNDPSHQSPPSSNVTYDTSITNRLLTDDDGSTVASDASEEPQKISQHQSMNVEEEDLQDVTLKYQSQILCGDDLDGSKIARETEIDGDSVGHAYENSDDNVDDKHNSADDGENSCSQDREEPFSLCGSYQDSSDFEEYCAYGESLDRRTKDFMSHSTLISNDLRFSLIRLNEFLKRPSSDKRIEFPSSSLDIIKKEWFRVTATKESQASKTKFYVDYFESFTKQILNTVVNLSDAAGNTAMHYAASYLNLDLMEVLLDTKVCDVNYRNRAGYTACMLISLADLDKPHEQKIAKRLFAVGDVNIQDRFRGQTALMLAARHGRTTTCRLLLESGADPSLQDNDGSTALMCGSEIGNESVVKCLLSHKLSDPTATDNDGLDALTIAVNNGHKEVSLLLYAAKTLPCNMVPSLGRNNDEKQTTRTASGYLGASLRRTRGKSQMNPVKRADSLVGLRPSSGRRTFNLTNANNFNIDNV